MKLRYAIRALCAVVILSIVCTLASAHIPQARAEEPRKPQLVATIFPAYDFARAIAAEGADIRLLLPPGSESHSYEPTPQDIIALQKADLLLVAGGESEHWIEELIASMGDSAPRVFSLMTRVEGLAEEYSPSMETDDHEGHDHEHEEHDHAELDEHVWTSPKNAQKIVWALAAVLAEMNPAEAETYQSRADAYLAELSKLDQALEAVVQAGARNKVIFGDRFPFRYLAYDYKLQYDAAFPGCSEDSEPSAQTIVSLIREIQRDDIPVVFHVEFSSRKIAELLGAETGAKLLLLHSCHNVSAAEMESGATYLSLMWNNVAALREALQ